LIAASAFPRRPIPVFGESVYGFERRFAHCARYDNLGAFRHVTGLLNLTPTSSLNKFTRLALFAGLEEQGLNSMRWLLPDGVNGARTAILDGHEIQSWHLQAELLSFCPSCLAEDGAGEQRIHLQAWQLRQVTACPRHNRLLAEACDCCLEPLAHRRKTKPWVCACGRDMADMETPPASEGAVLVSAAILERLLWGTKELDRYVGDKAWTLPEPFDELALDALLTILPKIGELAITEPGEDEEVGPVDKIYRGVPIDRSMANQETSEMMAAAHHVIEDWPTNMESVISSIAGRNPNPSIDHPLRSLFATRMGYRLLGPIKSIDGAGIRVIDDVLEQWLLNRHGIYIDGRQRAKVATEGDIAIDAADALRRLEGEMPTLGISAWSSAGAIRMIKKKVSLQSVEKTAERLAGLPSATFDEVMSAVDLGRRRVFSKFYRRHHALRDVLNGKIRTQRVPGNFTGLASLKLCAGDFRTCVEQATQQNSPASRAKRARKFDRFEQTGRIRALISQLWPDRAIPDITERSDIRRRVLARHYDGRLKKTNLYSVVDTLDLMQALYGSYETPLSS
jgi:hypothetical protein